MKSHTMFKPSSQPIEAPCLDCIRAIKETGKRAAQCQVHANLRMEAKKKLRRKEKKERKEKTAKREPKRLTFVKHVNKYHKYLKSSEWRQMRELILERAHYKCEDCGCDKPLQVHHLTYERLRTEFMTDLLALCDECHHKRHPDKH